MFFVRVSQCQEEKKIGQAERNVDKQANLAREREVFFLQKRLPGGKTTARNWVDKIG